MSTTRRRSRAFGVLLAVVGIGLFAFGAIAAGRPDLNVLDLELAGKRQRHLVTGLLGPAPRPTPFPRAAGVRGAAGSADRRRLTAQAVGELGGVEG